MKIKRYRPNYCEGFEDEYADVSSKEDLLKVYFVASWAEDTLESKFQEFCMDERYLVAFYKKKGDGKREWWVVARFLDAAEAAVAATWFNKPNYADR